MWPVIIAYLYITLHISYDGKNTVWNFINPHLSLMADNILLSFEGLWAGVTGKKPLITVDMLFMDFQVAAISKGLLAGLTAIDDICFHSMVRTGQDSSHRLQQCQKTNFV